MIEDKIDLIQQAYDYCDDKIDFLVESIKANQTTTKTNKNMLIYNSNKKQIKHIIKSLQNELLNKYKTEDIKILILDYANTMLFFNRKLQKYLYEGKIYKGYKKCQDIIFKLYNEICSEKMCYLKDFNHKQQSKNRKLIIIANGLDFILRYDKGFMESFMCYFNSNSILYDIKMIGIVDRWDAETTSGIIKNVFDLKLCFKSRNTYESLLFIDSRKPTEFDDNTFMYFCNYVNDDFIENFKDNKNIFYKFIKNI